jgi:hypothetical protein
LRLLGGRIAWLGEDIALSADAAHPTPRANDAFGSLSLPWEVRPYAERSIEAATPFTCIGGSMERLLEVFARAKQAKGCGTVAEVWPQLQVVFYSRRASDPEASALRAELGDGALLLQVGALREGIVAVEDPRHGLLRLLPDHGVYFEFVPAENGAAGPRLDVGQVECGVPYEMVVTSAAGVWACRAGVVVQFERRDPLLFHFVEHDSAPAFQTATSGVVPHDAVTAQPPHRRSTGTPAVRPESFVHTPWLTPADRG